MRGSRHGILTKKYKYWRWIGYLLFRIRREESQTSTLVSQSDQGQCFVRQFTIERDVDIFIIIGARQRNWTQQNRSQIG